MSAPKFVRFLPRTNNIPCRQMSTLRLTARAIIISAIMYQALKFLGILSSETTATSSTPNVMAAMAQPVVTDLMLRILSTTDAPPAYVSHLQKWYCIPTDLYLYTSKQSAWLYVKYADEKDLSAKDLVVVDITVGESPGDTWESRSGGIWMLRSKFSGKIDQAVTKVDVLFGTDAVDPRLHWDLMTSPLQLNALPSTPVARLSVLHGAKPRPDTQTPLRVEADGTFKMMLFSDSHMGTDKPCKDAIDANGKKLPEFEADPRTVDLMGKMLDKENPNLVVILGDLLHHDIRHSKTALFKLVAPIIKRKIPFAAVFGNHDDEGPHALSRQLCFSYASKNIQNCHTRTIGVSYFALQDSYAIASGCPFLLTRLQGKH